MKETSRNYTRPRRPAALRVANQLPATALDADALLAAARKHTGLSDFGDAFFREPFEVLIDAINREARLNAVGVGIMKARLAGLLQNRLRIEALIPRIEPTEIRRPIVIAGLQRTGTTLLHRLLAADPRTRALTGWEALAPAPLPGEGRHGNFRRRAAGKLAERALAWMAPEFFAVHPVESAAAEEDVLLLDHSFASQAPEATLYVPTYARWLEQHDITPAYRYLERILQLLTWQRPGDPWVLKTPHHLEYLHELLTVFPDAVIVQTHRDPLVTMPSFCSMVAHGRGVFSDHVEPREIGRHWLAKVRRMLDRSAAVREAHPGAFIDVSYYDLVRDPLAQVKRVYAHAGLDWTPAAEDALRAALRHEKQNRHGRHAYNLYDFGLSPRIVDASFADYRARFEIPREPGAPDAPLTSRVTGFGHRTTLAATATALLDLRDPDPSLPALDSHVRLDGRTAVVTGANSGLGKAVATDLARRGARVILACRSGIPEAGHDVARDSGSSDVSMQHVDLSDLHSVAAFTDALVARGEKVDILVCNAGLMPARPQQTAQGYDVMFGVHYLANHLMIARLIAGGVIAPATGERMPRVVLVASETHRSSSGLDFEHLGAPVDYGMGDAILRYGDSKLAAVTFASELARRYTSEAGPTLGVHALCPGAIASRITRDAPAFLEPVVEGAMRVMFQAPEAAALPVSYLAAAPELAGETAWYLHFMRRKAVSDAAADPANGKRLYEQGEAMLAEWLR